MHSQPSVAVVILNWNGQKFLQQFLPSVLASTYTNLRIVVADNASTDDSVALVKQYFSTVEILTGKENLGFAAGYNFFLKQIKADYYVLLNSDVEVTPNWIEPIISLMESNSKIAACQPKLLAFHHKNLFEYAGASGGWIDAYGYPFSRGRIFDVLEEDKGQYNNTAPIFWASGAAMFVRANVFHEMNGFDEFFFAHQEEIDLCWRMQRHGYLAYACPQSVVYHVGGGTLPTGNPKKVYLNFRNNLVMIAKNMPYSQLVWKLPFRILLDMVSAYKGLVAGKSSYFMAVIKAHLHFVRWVFTHKKNNTAAYPKVQGIYSGNIVWQYFVKKRKTFFEIVKNSSS